jgi:hypothetical protein
MVFPIVIFFSCMLEDSPALKELTLVTFLSTLVVLTSLFANYYFIG